MKKHFLLFVLSVFVLAAHSVNRFWIGNGTNTSWSNTSNWSTSSGGAGGASVPGSSDIAIFDNNGVGNCDVDATVLLTGMTVNATYTGTISQGSFVMSMGTSTFSGGTFLGGTANLNMNGFLTISGANFTSTSAKMEVAFNYTFTSGTFNHNNGLVRFRSNNSNTLVIAAKNTGSNAFNKLQFVSTNNASFIQVVDSIEVNDSLLFGYASGQGTNFQLYFNKPSGALGKIKALGNVHYYYATIFASNNELRISGSNSQHVTASMANNIAAGYGMMPTTIFKTAGSTVSFIGNISVGAYLKKVSGNVDNTNARFTFIGSNNEIAGNFTGTSAFSKAVFTKTSFRTFITDTIQVNDSLIIGNNGTGTLVRIDRTTSSAKGVINAKGSVTYISPYVTAVYLPQLYVTGSGTQIIRTTHALANAIAGGALPTYIIKAANETVQFIGDFNYHYSINYVSGIADFSQSRTVLSGGQAIIGGKFNNTSAFSKLYLLGGITYLTDSVQVNDSLIIGTPSFIAGSTTNSYVYRLPGNTNSCRLVAKGNVMYHKGAYYNGTGLVFMGNNEQYLNTVGMLTTNEFGLLPTWINKTSGSTLHLTGLLPTITNINYVSGTLDAGDSKIYMHAVNSSLGGKFTGTNKLNKLVFASNVYGGFINLNDTVEVADSVIFLGANQIKLSGGFVGALGHVHSTYNYSTSSPEGNSRIVFKGTGNQNISSTATGGAGSLPGIIVNKTSGTLTIASNITTHGQWRYDRGTVDAGTSTLFVRSGPCINTESVNGSMEFNNITFTTGSAAWFCTNTRIKGNLTIPSGVTLQSSGGSAFDIYVGGNWDNQGTFITANHRIILNGTANQTISKASGTETFYKLTVNKTSGYVQLNSPLTVNNAFTLTSGNIKTTSTNLLTLTAFASLTGGGNQSFVEGPMKKIGNTAFTFPLGSSLIANGYQPLTITAPTQATDAFTAEYVRGVQPYGNTLDENIVNLSSCEYWNLSRTGASNVDVTLGWNANSCNATTPAEMRVLAWDGAFWKNQGNAVYNGNATAGTVKSTGVISNYIAFTTAQNQTCNLNVTINSSDADNTICQGESVTLTASGATNYTWTPNTGGLNASNVAQVISTPVSSITYYVVGSDVLGCVDTSEISIIVNPKPSVNATANPTIVYEGNTSTITATGANTYAWSPSNTLNSSSGDIVTASPLALTTYTVIGSFATGCTDTNTVVVEVLQPEELAIFTTPDTTICLGNSVVLTADGADTYVWTPTTGLNTSVGSTVIATPSETTVYTVSGTRNGVTTSANITVYINPAINVNVGGPIAICTNDVAYLGGNPTVSGNGDYLFSWTPSAELNANNIPNPVSSATATTTYTLTVTDSRGCTKTDEVTVVVHPRPSATAGSGSTILVGSTFQLGGSPTVNSGTAPYTYTWLPSTNLDNATIANPTTSTSATTTYSVTVNDAMGCSASAQASVVVDDLSNARLRNPAGCSGNAITIAWTSLTGMTLDASTNTYTKTAVNGYTSASATSANLVYTNLVGSIKFKLTNQHNGVVVGFTNTNLSQVANDRNVAAPVGTNTWYVKIENKRIELIYNNLTVPLYYNKKGAEDYDEFELKRIYNTVQLYKNGNIIYPAPGQFINAMYTAPADVYAGIALDKTGAQIQNTTVDFCAPFTISAGNNQTICSGSNVTLGGAPTATGYGSFSYAWSPATGLSASNVSNPVANPTSTTAYNVIVTNSSSCCYLATTRVNVNPNPVANAGADKEINYSLKGTLGANPVATSGTPTYTYNWLPIDGLNNSALAQPVVSPATTTTYSVTVTDANGCTSSDNVLVTVNPSIYVNTTGLDSIYLPDVLQYTVSGLGLSGTYNAGGVQGLNAVLPTSGYSQLTLELGFNGISTGKTIVFDVDQYGNISNGRYTLSTATSEETVLIDHVITDPTAKIGQKKQVATIPIYVVGIILPIDILPYCPSDLTMNWTYVKTYDENGSVVGETKAYYDYLGRQLQTQTKYQSTKTVIATQTIYDAFGRAVITTLPAPTNSAGLCYVSNFVTNNDATPTLYSYNDFDKPITIDNSLGEINNPKPVANTLPGTLGYYYSNNNTAERFVPASSFPYSRVEYDDHSLGISKRSSMAGENLRMGSGHETQSFSMPVSGELKWMFGYGNFWHVDAVQYSNNSDGNTEAFVYPVFNIRLDKAFKTISYDQNGLETVSFVDNAGSVVAKCMSGQVNGANVKTLKVSSYIKVFNSIDDEDNYVDIHLPQGCENSLQLPNYQQDNTYLITYKIFDLKASKYLTFSGDEEYKGTNPNIPPGIYRIFLISDDSEIDGSLYEIKYDVNYYDATLFYYDHAKRLVATAPPLGTANFDVDAQLPSVTSQESFNPIYHNPNAQQKWTFDNATADKKYVEVVLPNLPQGAGSGDNRFTNVNFYFTTENYAPGDGNSYFKAKEVPDEITRVSNQNYYNADLSLMGHNLSTLPNIDTELLIESQSPDYKPEYSKMISDIYKVKFSITAYNSLGTLVDVSKYATPSEELLFEKRNGQWLFYSPPTFSGGWYGTFLFHLPQSISDQIKTVRINVDYIKRTHAEWFYYPIHTNDEFEAGWYPYVTPALMDVDNAINDLKLLVNTATYDVPQGVQHKMLSTNTYNSLGWLLSKQSPDQGVSSYVYRTDGAIRFSQNALQRSSNADKTLRKFSYSNYDKLGRLIESGEYNPALPGTLTNYFFETHNEREANPTITTSVHQILETNSLDPARCTEQSYILYDTPDNTFAASTGLSNYKQEFVRGKVSRTRNANATCWYSYDELGRTVWMVQRIENMPTTGTFSVKTIDYKYDMLGNVLEVAYQKNVPAESFYHFYTYDKDKRLSVVYTSVGNNTNLVEQARYHYYKHGPLKRVELANKLQGVDYVYTINGWLKSLNSPDLDDTRDPGTDGNLYDTKPTPKDLFGMSLDYFSGDYTRQNTFVQTYDAQGNSVTANVANDMYNGMIKAQRWKTAIPTAAAGQVQYTNNQLMNGYLYDKKYQLINSHFGTITAAGSLNGGAGQVPSFNAGISDYRVNNLQYDANGNIKFLDRYAYGANNLMDKLRYVYYPNNFSNKLVGVSDDANGTAFGTLDFDPSLGAYGYDLIGQLTKDPLESNYYNWDARGKVTAVYSNSDKTNLRASFAYDEKGYRIKKSTPNGDTWYIRDASGNVISVYEKPVNGTLAQTELYTFGSGRLGNYDKATGKYLYEITDHLGNVRATFRTQTVTAVSTGYDMTAPHDYLIAYNNTIDNTLDISGSTGSSVKLTPTNRFGPGIKIPVTAGQEVNASLFALHNLITTPDAVMVMALEDENGNSIANTWVGVPVPGGPGWRQLSYNYKVNDHAPASAPVKMNLFIYPWNNDASATVWFDNLTISITPNTAGIGGITLPEQQSLTDYYPHGGLMPGRNFVNVYRFGYQGQEKDAETGKNAFELRFWDGKLGRWITIDPKEQYHNPYLGMGNNPVNMNDPDGGASYNINDPVIGFNATFSSNGSWNFDLNVSMQQSYGDFNLYNGFGVSYQHNFFNSNVSGLELRGSLMLNYNDGYSMFSLGTNYWNGLGGMSEFTQRTGMAAVGWGKFNLMYENDGAPFPGRVFNDNNDSYRTAALRVGLGDIQFGFNLGTGLRYNFDDKTMMDEGLKTGDFNEKYPHGFVHEEGRPYRMGYAYVGYKNYMFGLDSDRWLRHPIQDYGAHHYIPGKQQPGFKSYSNDVVPILKYNANPLLLNINPKYSSQPLFSTYQRL